MTKSPRQLNQEHELRELMRVRPKPADYKFAELEQIVAGWVRQRVAEKQQPAG